MVGGAQGSTSHTLQGRTFYVEDPQATPGSPKQQTLIIDLRPIETHLAECEKFVMHLATEQKRPKDEEILKQVLRIDWNIRTEWWRLFIKNEPRGRTFASCISETRSFAMQQWKQGFSQLLFPSGSTPWTPDNRTSWGNDWSPHETKRSAGKKGIWGQGTKKKGKDKCKGKNKGKG